jgi:hypothetical protein
MESRRLKALLIGGMIAVIVAAIGVIIVNLSSQGSGDDPSPNSAPVPGVELRPVDGGTGYYGKFADPLPTNPSYFPIGLYYVSLATQSDVDGYKAAGINTFVEVDPNSPYDVVKPYIQKDDIHVIAVKNAGNGTETNGWSLDDEVDMNYGPGDGKVSADAKGDPICIPAKPGCGYTKMAADLKKFPADNRIRFSNYGKGVLFWDDNTDAGQFVNTYQDMLSADAYWFQDRDLCSFSQGGTFYPQSDLVNGLLPDNICHIAANYGKSIDKERSLESPPGSKPIWGFIEDGHASYDNTPQKPNQSMPAPTPADVTAGVWSNLIHGARGIVYFNNAYGGCKAQDVLSNPCYSAVRAAITKVDAQITTLAPELNAPFADGVATASSGVDLSTKWYKGHFYVFAGSNQSASQNATFSLPCVGNATVTVLDENRTIKMSSGTFTDAFADSNAYHLYRVDGGTSCGLKK